LRFNTRCAARAIISAMSEQRTTAPEEPVESARQGLWPSVALTAGITAVTWLSIAFIFILGYIGFAVFGDIGSGARGLAIWAVLWIAMWAVFTLALGGGLVAAFRAWKAVYPLFQPRARQARPSTATAAAETLDDVKRMAVEEAEALLQQGDE
jgi:hypothetical protein